jgi:CheY-like chemotaxis protein
MNIVDEFKQVVDSPDALFALLNEPAQRHKEGNADPGTGPYLIISKYSNGGISGKAIPEEKKQQKRIQSSPGRKGKVLVMDDDPFIISFMRSFLKDSGYDVRTVRNGVEAIEYFKEARALGTPFDAVILDLHVPSGMGGEEALAKLRDVDPGVKAILLTADNYHPALSEYETHGFKSTVVKPFTRNDLQRALDRAFGKSSDGPGESPAA